jgi:hypothetical protein
MTYFPPEVPPQPERCPGGAATLGLTAKLQPEDCAALLRAIGEGV